MTFEEWWVTLTNQPIPQLKPTFRDCWNTALEAVMQTDAVINASSAEVEELESLRC